MPYRITLLPVIAVKSIEAAKPMEDSFTMEIITNFSQAAATLLAVILAYLLSILTDRSSWKHRKKEQIREHQLDSLKSLIHIMQKIDSSLQIILEIKNKCLQKTTSESSSAIRKNIHNSANSEIRDVVSKFSELKSSLAHEYWELKLLKYGESQLAYIDNYITEFNTLSSKFIVLQDYIDAELVCQKSIDHINQLFTSYIGEAEDGLTK